MTGEVFRGKLFWGPRLELLAEAQVPTRWQQRAPTPSQSPERAKELAQGSGFQEPSHGAGKNPDSRSLTQALLESLEEGPNHQLRVIQRGKGGQEASCEADILPF